jgi:hypothetical protein
MLLSLRNLVLSAAALCSTAAFAATQTRVALPFNFVVEKTAYQAGSYTVEVDSGRSFVTLANITKPSQSLTWILGPGVYDASPTKVRLIFDVMGSDHVLRSIQCGALITPNMEGGRKHKVESTTIIGE